MGSMEVLNMKDYSNQTSDPYKGHEHDGGDDYGLVVCLKCEKQMLWNFNNSVKKEDKQ